MRHTRIYSARYGRDPVIAQITKQYLKGRPFCCEVCEALTAKGSDKLLMCPCRTIAYCSRDCQVKNWNKHKVECQGPLNDRGRARRWSRRGSRQGREQRWRGGAAGAADGGLATGKKKGKKPRNEVLKVAVLVTGEAKQSSSCGNYSQSIIDIHKTQYLCS